MLGDIAFQPCSPGGGDTVSSSKKGVCKPVNTNLTKRFREFLESEQAAGVILILCTLTAIVIANSPFGYDFLALWHSPIGFELGDINLKFYYQTLFQGGDFSLNLLNL